jgi:hypothetical protein
MLSPDFQGLWYEQAARMKAVVLLSTQDMRQGVNALKSHQRT